MSPTAATEHWHLDKRVPIALIFAIFLQSVSAVWWAASISERMSQIERRQEGTGRRTQEADMAISTQGQRIAVLSEAVANTNRNLERLQSELTATNGLLRELLIDRPNGGR